MSALPPRSANGISPSWCGARRNPSCARSTPSDPAVSCARRPLRLAASIATRSPDARMPPRKPRDPRPRLEWRHHYVDEHRAVMIELDLESCEIFTRLKDLYWKEQSIPIDIDQCVARIGLRVNVSERDRLAKKVEEVLVRFFKKRRSGWIHEGLRSEREHAENTVKSRRESGAKGGLSSRKTNSEQMLSDLEGSDQSRRAKGDQPIGAGSATREGSTTRREGAGREGAHDFDFESWEAPEYRA